MTHQPIDPQPGERREDITFVSLMQQGMSSNIYLTWHHRYLAPMVCKMLRAEEYSDARWRQLLQNEAQVIQKVTHPNIVRLFEMNMDAPLPYILLDYLPGQTVRRFLRQTGRFNLQDALRLIISVGATLAHVHHSGYIHRDVKPSNVMLHAGYVKLFDFGVAWPLSHQKPPDKSGTPMYLAPEQCRQQVLTPATDIWQLGIFLFELLTNQLPFAKSNYDDYDAPPEKRYSQLTMPPKTLQEAGRRAPIAVQRILNRCLAFEATERYQKIEDFLIELDPLCKTKIWPALPVLTGKPHTIADFVL